jgi:PKD repeat protein
MGMNSRIMIVCAAACLAVAAPTAAHAAPAWLAPVTVATATDYPIAAMGTGGDIVVGGRASVTPYATSALMRPAGGAFDPGPQAIAGSTGATSLADVAVNGRGDAVAGWVADTAVYIALRPRGSSTFGPPIAVGPNGGASGNDDPQVGIADDGTVAIGWLFYTGAKFTAHYALRSAAGVLGPVFSSDPAQGVYGSPQVAMNDAGDTIFTWARSNGTKYVVQAASRPRGGDLGAPVDLSDSGQDATSPSPAVAQDGATVVAWTRSDGTNALAQVTRRPAGGSFGLPVTLSAAGANAGYAAASVNRAGDVLVAWTRGAVAQARLGTLTGGFAPVTDFGSGGGRTAAVIDDTGLGLVTYGAGSEAFGSIRPPGGSFGPPLSLAPTGTPVTVFSNIVVASAGTDTQGDAVAIWGEYSGGTTNVGARIFDGAAPALGAISGPGSATAGQAVAFSASATDRMSAVGPLAWSFGDGAGATGASVTHTYNNAGIYTVKVTATDAAGNATSATRSITVGAVPAPVAPAPPALPGVTPPKPKSPTRCKVPKLTGLTYTRAKEKLTSAHCKVGKTTKPKGHKTTKNLVVKTQSRTAGTSTTAGAKVDITMKVKPKKKTKKKH